MRKIPFLGAVFLGASFVITGCAAPGVQLKPGHKTVVLHEGESGALDLDKVVDIYPITPTLIYQMEQGAVTAAAGSSPHATSRPAPADYEYRVGAGDVLQIVVWGHPDLNPAAGSSALQGSTSMLAPRLSGSGNGTVVDAQGMIFFPYAGKLHVAGMSASQIRTLLTQRLSRYLRQPQVDVTVASYQARRINVTGAVKTPGQLPLSNAPMRVLDAISLAGGVADNGDSTQVKLIRDGVEHVISVYDIMNSGKMQHNVLLGANDVIFVPSNEQRRIHVMGEVTKQTSLIMPPSGMSLTDALGRSEGINQTIANARGVFVIRGIHPASNADLPVAERKIAHVYQLDARDASAYALANRFALQPNDVVFVTISPVGKWNRVLSQVFPSITLLGNMAAVYNATK